MSRPKAKARPQRAPRKRPTQVRLKNAHTLMILRPESTREDRQALLRQLQKALAVAKCIRIAVNYGNDDLDVSDAVSGVVALLEDIIAGLDLRGGVEELRQFQAVERQPDKTNSLIIAEGPALNAEDYALILRALDVLKRQIQSEFAALLRGLMDLDALERQMPGEVTNKRQQADLIETWSRILITRGKVQNMREAL